MSSIDPFNLPPHGGDLATAEARFGRPAEGWLDLSTGINPFPYPIPEIATACWERLPDFTDEGALRAIAAAAYGVADPDQVVAVPGSQALIQLLPRIRPFSQVAVVGPTYGEHVTCWTNAGHQVLACETLERVGDADVVVVVNPNNPDGHRYDPSRLLELAAGLASREGLLVVDEAFCDMAPELSLAGRVRPGLLVMRSFGKFFGLGGLRLGFAIADKPLARLLRTAFGPWSVSGPALAVGRQALGDEEWITTTRQRLAEECAELDAILSSAHLSVLGGTHLFRLVNAPRAWALYEHLGHRGILVRPFAAAPRWLRFGLPAGGKGRKLLRQALAEWAE